MSLGWEIGEKPFNELLVSSLVMTENRVVWSLQLLTRVHLWKSKGCIIGNPRWPHTLFTVIKEHLRHLQQPLPHTQHSQTKTLESSTQFAAWGFASPSPGHHLIHPWISTMHAEKNPTEHNLGCGFTGSSSQSEVTLMLKAEVQASRYSHTPALASAFVLEPRGHGMSPGQSANLVENKFLSF